MQGNLARKYKMDRVDNTDKPYGLINEDNMKKIMAERIDVAVKKKDLKNSSV